MAKKKKLTLAEVRAKRGLPVKTTLARMLDKRAARIAARAAAEG